MLAFTTTGDVQRSSVYMTMHRHILSTSLHTMGLVMLPDENVM